jgi:hypothetical protein
LKPKSEKCIFFGYSKDVKGYIILQPHCNELIIRRDANFDENIFSRKLDSTCVPSSTCKPSSNFVPCSIPIMVSYSSDDDNEDENLPTPAHLPLDDSIENDPTPTPSLPLWVCSTWEAVGDIVGDPSD